MYKFFRDYIYKKQHRPPRVLDVYETINLIIDKNLSVARFGDGEFDMIMDINHPKFQEDNVILSNKLKNVLHKENSNLLVCIPNVLSNHSLDKLNGRAKRHWQRFFMNNRKSIYKELNFTQIYGDALFTRQYIDLKNKNNVIEYYSKIKEIWGGNM